MSGLAGLSDGLLLWLALLGVQLLECVLAVDRQALLFVDRAGLGWRARRLDSAPGGARSGLALLDPVPPLGRALVGRFLPLSLSPDGVCTAPSQRIGGAGPDAPPRWLPWSELGEVAARDGRLRIGGAPDVPCADQAEALELAALLDELRPLEPAARDARLRVFWRARLDGAAARATVRELSLRLRPLRLAGSLLWFALFAGLPALARVVGLHAGFAWLVGAALAASAVAGAAFWIVHRRLRPDDLAGRVAELAKGLLCPPALVRAFDGPLRAGTAGLDALALGAGLLRGEERRRFLSERIRDLAHPVGRDGPAEAELARRWQNERQLEVLALAEDGLVDSTLREAPPRSTSLGAYCPRCLSGYGEAATECSDCAGVRLAPVDGSASRRTTP